MSTTTVSSHFRSFIAAAAIAAAIRVKVDSSGNAAVAGATDAAIGTTEHAVASGDPVTVKLYAPTLLATASEAITRGNQVYPAASGKIAATGTTALNLVALEAATADGDQIECAVVQKGA